MKHSKVRINAGRLRKNRHLTQSEVAKKSGLSKTTISNLESGRQSKIELETIAKLCSTLHCTPNDLFEIYVKEDDPRVRSQKLALKKYEGSCAYDVEFQPDDLDRDLAELI